MVSRPLIIADANTIWHRRLAEALGAKTEAIAVLPQKYAIHGLNVRGPETAPKSALQARHVATVPGWASVLSEIGQRQIAARIQIMARDLSAHPAVILTSPAYTVLSRILAGRYPLIYYCADDYREYIGWGGSKTAKSEQRILDRCDLSVFVSDALRNRAIEEYRVREQDTLTSPNATEPRFLAECTPSLPHATSTNIALCKRPIVGILGGLSSRLDVDLVQHIADVSELGTLAIIGPLSADSPPSAAKLLRHPKVVVTGIVPHGDMHSYAHELDAALIPYAPRSINYYCSPMRLYDHLATGVPIFATNACRQINELYVDRITVAPAFKLPLLVATALRELRLGAARQASTVPGGLLWSDRANKLIAAIDRL